MINFFLFLVLFHRLCVLDLVLGIFFNCAIRVSIIFIFYFPFVLYYSNYFRLSWLRLLLKRESFMGCILRKTVIVPLWEKK